MDDIKVQDRPWTNEKPPPEKEGGLSATLSRIVSDPWEASRLSPNRDFLSRPERADRAAIRRKIRRVCERSVFPTRDSFVGTPPPGSTLPARIQENIPIQPVNRGLNPQHTLRVKAGPKAFAERPDRNCQSYRSPTA